MADHMAEKARRRCDQIAWTAHRVLPTDVGVWTRHEGAISPAEAVVIAPADLMWLIQQVRTPPGKEVDGG